MGKDMLRVYEIERDTDNVVVALGMTESRASELATLCEIHMSKADNVVEVVEIVSKECKHANELYYVSMVITIIHEQMKEPKVIKFVIREEDLGEGSED